MENENIQDKIRSNFEKAVIQLVSNYNLSSSHKTQLIMDAYDNAVEQMIKQKQLVALFEKEIMKAVSDNKYSVDMVALGELSPSDILNAFDKYQDQYKVYKKGNKNFADVLEENKMGDSDFSLDYIDAAQEQLLYDIEYSVGEEKYNQMIDAVSEEFDDVYNAIDYMFEKNKLSMDFDMSQITPNCELNIMFETSAERNFDMGSINAFYKTPLDNGVEDFIELGDNALNYLIHQQGYKASDVFESFEKMVQDPEHREKGFISSVSDEIENNGGYDMNELTVLVSASGKDLFDLLDQIASGKDYLTFPKNTSIGLFNEWNGSGSTFDITLDKPFVVPANMVRNVQIEDANDNYGYTVNQVYGLTPECWNSKAGVTKDAPQLVSEDYSKLYAKIEKYNEKSNEKNNKKTKNDIERD